jgi:PAS domain S-box-containing protein
MSVATSELRPDQLDAIFPGNGEMASRCRAFDWSATSLGPVHAWPQSLKTTVGLLLASRNPMFLWWGPDLIQIYNDAYRPSFGEIGRHPQALGMRGRECWTDIWQTIGPEIEQVMTTGEPTWHEDASVPIWRNGRMEDVWWTYSYSPVYDEAGHIAGTLVVCQETTQRVITQARLRAVYDGTHEYIGLLTPNGTLLEANRASLAFIGRERAEVLGSVFWETPWFTHTPGAPELIRDGVERAARGEFVRHTTALHKSSGELRTFDVSLLPFRDEHGVVRFVVVEGRDITEREQLVAELRVERARLAEVFNQAPSFLAVLRGPEHVFELVNDAYSGLIGYRDVVGKRALDALPEVAGQGFLELLDRVFRTGEPFIGREVEVRLVRSPGAEPDNRFLDFVYQPLIEADGTCSGVVAHGSDVTAQVLARRDIERLLADSEQARGEAEAANRSKSEFLAVMSHELRTPLNAIGGYAELMEMELHGAVTPEQRDDLTRIQMSQRHLLGLINEVLNYAKLETGTVGYDMGPVDLADALVGAHSLVATQARSRRLELTVGECQYGVAANADPEKLRQILVNLLSNAVKFTNAGGRITMWCETETEHVRIYVRDTGIGIPEDKLEVIFDPFVQVRADLTRRHEGTGLGLAISRDLARGMGGELVARSAVGEGSTFMLTLERYATR